MAWAKRRLVPAVLWPMACFLSGGSVTDGVRLRVFVPGFLVFMGGWLEVEHHPFHRSGERVGALSS
jgi:hypothetical protein